MDKDMDNALPTYLPIHKIAIFVNKIHALQHAKYALQRRREALRCTKYALLGPPAQAQSS